MSEIESVTNEAETQPEPDPIEGIYQGDCPSISERSTISYAVGRHPDGTLHFRLVGNTGGGMYCDEWIPGSDIDALVVGHTELTSRSFQVLKPGRSTNTAGFVMAAVKSLGLLEHHQFQRRYPRLRNQHHLYANGHRGRRQLQWAGIRLRTELAAHRAGATQPPKQIYGQPSEGDLHRPSGRRQYVGTVHPERSSNTN